MFSSYVLSHKDVSAMTVRRFFGFSFVLLLSLGFLANSLNAQSNATRPAGTTFLGDTGLWFVPTAEVIGNGQFAASGHHTTFNREQGFTAIQSSAGTFTVGVRDRLEIFGSFQFLTRLDRDLQPVFQPSRPHIGGINANFPFADQAFSGNAIGDLVIGTKINLRSERTQSPFALAIRTWAKIPTGNQEAGTTTGKPDIAVGLITSKAAGAAEISGHFDYVFRGDPDNVELPQSVRWGLGVGAPLRGPIRIFGELLGDVLTNSTLRLDEPIVGFDGSLSGLQSLGRQQLDVVIGAQWQSENGVSIGGGLTWAARHWATS